MKTLNQKIVRILLNHCEVLKYDDRLIQVIPSGDIEDIANEIEHQVKPVDLADVVKSLPNDIDIMTHIKIVMSGTSYSEEYSDGFEDGVRWLKQQLPK